MIEDNPRTASSPTKRQKSPLLMTEAKEIGSGAPVTASAGKLSPEKSSEDREEEAAATAIGADLMSEEKSAKASEIVSRFNSPLLNNVTVPSSPFETDLGLNGADIPTDEEGPHKHHRMYHNISQNYEKNFNFHEKVRGTKKQ